MINHILAVLSGRKAEPKVDSIKDRLIIGTDHRVCAVAYMRNNRDRPYHGVVNQVDVEGGRVELVMNNGDSHWFPRDEVHFLEAFQPVRL